MYSYLDKKQAFTSPPCGEVGPDREAVPAGWGRALSNYAAPCSAAPIAPAQIPNSPHTTLILTTSVT